jgi:hypothetical protein
MAITDLPVPGPPLMMMATLFPSWNPFLRERELDGAGRSGILHRRRAAAPARGRGEEETLIHEDVPIVPIPETQFIHK